MNTNLVQSQPHYTILDQSAKYPAARSHLHLLVAPYSIQICTYYEEDNILSNLKKYLFEEPLNATQIASLFTDDPLLQFHYMGYHVHFFSMANFLMPSNEPIQHEKKLLSQEIPSIGASIHYEVDRSILHFFEDKSNFRIHSSTAGLIGNLLKRQRNTRSNAIYAHILDTHIEIMAFEKESLLLHNIFPIDKPEDCSYFILSVYESLKFSTSRVPIILMGSISKPSKIYDQLYTYIQDVQFIGKNASINYTNAFDDIEEHIIYPLSTLLQT